MLVAFASFVLHGSAMARIGSMHATAATADHHHAGGIPDHHHHATAHGDCEHGRDGADAPDHHGTGGLCCGSFCATAITPFLPSHAVSRVETSAAVRSSDATGHGVAREGLRKPPRTPDIA